MCVCLSYWNVVHGWLCVVVTLLQILCRAPANYGVGHPLVVTATGQSSEPFSFDYDPPVIVSVSPADDPLGIFDAQDGVRVSIVGYNFGVSLSSTPHGEVYVGTALCTNQQFIGDSQVRVFRGWGQA